jgi:hypothetical protein
MKSAAGVSGKQGISKGSGLDNTMIPVTVFLIVQSAVDMPLGDDIGRMRALLEYVAKTASSAIIFDPDRITDAVIDEIKEILLSKWGEKVAIVPMLLEDVASLFVFVPPDHMTRYEAGFPLLIAPVSRGDGSPNPEHRPTDDQIIKNAKVALEAEAFRLTGRQTAVEMARNTRSRNLTKAEAESRAKTVIAEAIWRGGQDPNGKGKKRRLAGLIDRGRRIAAMFFGTRKPGDQLKIEATHVAERVKAEGRNVLSSLEDDNRSRARAMSWNASRTEAFSRAMSQWVASAQKNEAVGLVDGIEITNAVATRMDAPALMKLAISSGLDPSTVHQNVLLERPRFAVGVVLGELIRHRSIEFTPEHAAILHSAIATVEQRRSDTHADHCDALLVEAALRCRNLEFWKNAIDRVLGSAISERIND